MIHRLVESLAARYADGKHAPEGVIARREYMERAGKVFDDDGELFEARMASFLEWFVIDRPFQGGAPPVVQTLEEGAWGVDERRELAWLATSRWSLFDVVAVSESGVEVEDAIGGSRFVVIERRSTVGFQVGDLLEARVLWDGLAPVFGKTFLFHPREAREAALRIVEAEVAKATPREEIVFHLSRLHVRWRRYGHIAAARVYGGDV